MSKKPVTQPQDKYVLRLPEGMRDRIKAAAEINKRSMNAEIISALESAFPADQVKRVRTSLTEEEKEDIWEWLQQKARSAKGDS